MKVKKGEQIVKQGQEGNEFYIIVAGSVRVERVDDQGEYHLIKDKLGVGAYFGEMALLDEKARMASVVANEDCTLQWINKRVFNNLFGSMADTMQREADRRKREIERKSRPPMQHKDLEVMRTLGVGSFGRVRMVKHVPTSMPYALKCMRKGQMIAMRQVDHVRNEKDILAMCDHPFILNLEATFQDADELYMAFELILGGELFTLLRGQGKFSMYDASFYAGCVASGFAYLHERKIVYRDLKPENLMLDADGYTKIVDFGFAKIVPEKTYTLCGTPDYLAPEIIQNKGHNTSADWWSFGVLVYEFLIGHAPFEAEDPMDIYNNILNESPRFPPLFNGIARSLIEALLKRNPSTRLGSLGLGSYDIIEHDFFGDISFTELELKSIEAPHKPQIKDPLDADNFDEVDDDSDDSDDEEMVAQLAEWKTHNKDPNLFANF